MIPIFISRPNPFTAYHDSFLKCIFEILNKNNMEGFTLKSKNYSPYESLSCLNEMIKRSFGLIIIAFGQLYIEKGYYKPCADGHINHYHSIEQNIDNSWITSPFCHIEGALAFGHNIPILIIEQNGVRLDGLLKSGDHATIAPPFSLELQNSGDLYFKDELFLKKFELWKLEVLAKYKFILNTE